MATIINVYDFVVPVVVGLFMIAGALVFVSEMLRAKSVDDDYEQD